MPQRTEQKRQTRQALLDGARQLTASGRGFCSLSLREVARTAQIVPTGFYRHFADMDELGLALVNQVGETFRHAIRLVRQNELAPRSLTEASVNIFLDHVQAHREQFLFLAREQYGGSQAIRQSVAKLRQGISDDLASDLAHMPRWQHLSPLQLQVMADLVVKTVFATLPELIDAPAGMTTQDENGARSKLTDQLRLIFMGARHWHHAQG